ncbi:putative holin-like toxin [Paenibacillus sp. CECT 9249]|nr:hypothetical protein PAE9249_01692 [Paenibacillus sp. CECT 9249]
MELFQVFFASSMFIIALIQLIVRLIDRDGKK